MSYSGKRLAKILEDTSWDCTVCTFRNKAEAFKCLMCDMRRGTSTRKPKSNTTLAAQQAAQQQFSPMMKPNKKESSSGSSTTDSGKDRKQPKSRRKKWHPPRLRNVDRSTAQSKEVTVNNVTVVITEYRPKLKKNSDQSGLSSSASSVDGSHLDSNHDSRSLGSLDNGTDN